MLNHKPIKTRLKEPGSRTLIFTGGKEPFLNQDKPEIEIHLNYEDRSNVYSGIKLDLDIKPFIIKAINNYESLLESLKNARWWIDMEMDPKTPSGRQAKHLLRVINTAIRNTTKKEG